MLFSNDNNFDITESMSLLISLIVRYPEMTAINFDLDGQTLKFTFLIKQVNQDINETEMKSFSSLLKSSIDTIAYLENKNIDILNINFDINGAIVLLEVERDAESISVEELAVIVEMVENKYHNNLITEQTGSLSEEEELVFQEILINNFPGNEKEPIQPKQLIAYRDDGRVLIYNK